MKMLRILRSPVDVHGNSNFNKQHYDKDQSWLNEYHPVKVQFLQFFRKNKNKHRKKHAKKHVHYARDQETLEILFLFICDETSYVINMHNKG